MGTGLAEAVDDQRCGEPGVPLADLRDDEPLSSGAASLLLLRSGVCCAVRLPRSLDG